MKKILVIAPHPDDETIGCGGTILKHIKAGDKVSCIFVTKLKKNNKWSEKLVKKKEKEIDRIKKIYKFSFFKRLDFLPTELDKVPFKKLVTEFTKLFSLIKPEVIYIPYINDVHTDHKIVSKAATSSAKWFRSSSIKQINMYETLSETNFNFVEKKVFQPNLFIDISKFLEKKIKICSCYKTEFGKHPFPRSKESIKALAILRGSQSGYKAAESFKVVFKK